MHCDIAKNDWVEYLKEGYSYLNVHDNFYEIKMFTAVRFDHVVDIDIKLCLNLNKPIDGRK